MNIYSFMQSLKATSAEEHTENRPRTIEEYAREYVSRLSDQDIADNFLSAEFKEKFELEKFNIYKYVIYFNI